MSNAAELNRAHWNETPLYLTEEARYNEYPWLCEAGEFTQHSGERILETGVELVVTYCSSRSMVPMLRAST